MRPAAALCSDEVKLRDRALFLIGLVGAFRRSELVAVDWVRLRIEAAHVTIHLPRSKGDQEEKEADVIIQRMRDEHGAPSETCPVRVLEAWLRKARIDHVPVFRSVTSGGRLGDRFGSDGVRHILLRRAEMAKLTVHPSERLSPHGLRAGMITEA